MCKIYKLHAELSVIIIFVLKKAYSILILIRKLQIGTYHIHPN